MDNMAERLKAQEKAYKKLGLDIKKVREESKKAVVVRKANK